MNSRLWLRVLSVGIGLTALAPAAFLPRNEAERKAALGDLSDAPPALRAAVISERDFDLIPLPEKGDWLDAHNEVGQPYAAFVASHPNRVNEKRRVLYLQPLGDFPRELSPSLAALSRYASAFFQMEVKILPVYEPGAMEFSPRVNPGTRQVQVLTRPILDFLGKRLPDDAFCVLGITMQDLYPAASWNYVFGQASLTRRVGVYSFARYNPDFFGDELTDQWKNQMLRRSCKVLAHEAGHMFGLSHCIYFDCAMNGSNNLAESDQRTLQLCPVCLRKLHHGAGFDVVKRYRELATFYRECGWIDDARWCEEQAENVEKAVADGSN